MNTYNEFNSMLPNFYWTLGRNETLTKKQFIDRIRQMFCVESDPRTKYFVNIANETPFSSIHRNFDTTILLNC